MYLVKRLPEKSGFPPLAVPLSIRILKKCVKYRIDSQMIKRLHFFDLQCLLIQFETQDIIDYLEHEKKVKMKEQGIKEIKDISGSDAIKFLGR